MHNGFLQIEGEKMSKSLGNFFTVQDLISSGLTGEVIRMVLMSTHYRQPLDWTNRRVADASKVLKKWRSLCAGAVAADSPSPIILNALADDLNIPKAYAELHSLAASGNYSDLLASARFLGLMEKGFNQTEQIQDLNELDKDKIESLLAERLDAKKNKDFAKADRIRKRIEEVGISIKDQPDKTEWNLLPSFDSKKMKDLS